MNNIEAELCKILSNTTHQYDIVGTKAYINNGKNKYAICFAHNNSSDYNALHLSVCNAEAGVFDENLIDFATFFGKIHTNNPNFPDGCYLRLYKNDFTDRKDYEWYVVKPTLGCYKMLGAQIETYIEIFG